MKILKNEGAFEVLTKPEDVIRNIALAARTCYQSQDKANEESDLKLVRNLMNREHFAMFEFSNMNVRFSNVCRGFTHEMVRHRLCSFAQESTRYVDESDLHVVVPPHKDEEDCRLVAKGAVTASPFSTLGDFFHTVQNVYSTLRSKGWKAEDARQVLPIATRSQIVVGTNVREWRHIFHMRCDKFAHWEIRSVMLKLLKWCQENIPLVFDDFEFMKTESGQEYARQIVPVTRLTERIIEFMKFRPDEAEKLFSKLDDITSLRIYNILKERHWK